MWVAPYSDYQQFLYNTINDLLSEGLNYQEIADRLNEQGYLTPRGKKFRNAHAHSIVKRKKIRDVRIHKTYEPETIDFSLRVTDKTLANDVGEGE